MKLGRNRGLGGGPPTLSQLLLFVGLLFLTKGLALGLGWVQPRRGANGPGEEADSLGLLRVTLFSFLASF